MKIGPLSFLNRTSSKSTFNVASWHSPHSLTWRWIVSLRRHPFMVPKPFAHRNSVGWGVGLGTLLSFTVYRDNNGLQPEVSVLWHGLHLSQQRPMWFKDMIHRAWDEREVALRDVRKLEREIEALRFASSRAADQATGAHLN
jgi:hypothetical protein